MDIWIKIEAPTPPDDYPVEKGVQAIVERITRMLPLRKDGSATPVEAFVGQAVPR